MELFAMIAEYGIADFTARNPICALEATVTVLALLPFQTVSWEAPSKKRRPEETTKCPGS